MKTNLKSVIRTGSFILIGVIVIIGVAIHSSFNSLQEREYWVAHTNQVLNISQKLLSLLNDTQIGQRGYIITNDSLYLDPYFKSIDSIPVYIYKLKEITADNAQQQSRIEDLYIGIQNAIQSQRYTVLLQAKGDLQAVGNYYKSGEGKKRIDYVKQLIQEIIQEENRLFISRTEALTKSISFTKIITYLTIICCALVVAVLFRIILFQLRKRDLDAQKLNELNYQLSMANNELLTYNEELNTHREELYTTVEHLEEMKDLLEKRVEERTANLKEANEKLIEEVGEHKRTGKELQKRNYELDNYVYKVSHDLRAPLTSILGLISLIQMEKEVMAVKQYVTLIENRVTKLDDFIKSILNHSKTINSELVITHINFELIISDCLEELRYLPNWPRINIENSFEGESVFYSDELRITILFKNFISNAIKYLNPTVERSYLKIDVHVSLKEAIIIIADNGIGIDPEYVDKIFNMFFRATASSDGSGLGLYIVKQTLEKLEGDISVESQINKGTTFKIILPNFVAKAKEAISNS